MGRAGAASTRATRLPTPGRIAAPWVDAYPPGVPPTYRWPSVPLPRLLDDAARDFPGTAGACDPDGTWTWAQLQVRAVAVAAALRQAGVGPGDRVGLACDRGPVAVAVAFATWRVGAILVPVPPSSPSDRAWLLAAAAPRLTVVATEAVEDWFHVDHPVVHVDVEDLAPPGRARRLLARRGRGAASAPTSGPRPWAGFVGAAGGESTALPPVDPGTAAVLLPTRDRAGRRRLVVLTHRNLVANALQARLWVPDVQAGREVVLCPAPLHTPVGLVGGLLLAALSAGALVRVDPAAVPAAGSAAPTLVVGRHRDLAALVVAAEHGRADLSSLRVGLVVGPPLSDDLRRRLRQVSGHARLRRAGGVAEASFLTHANPVYGRADPAHVGLPVSGTVAAVVDAADPTRLLADGDVGRLVVAGPQVMAGYWQDPAASAAVLRDGWLLTEATAVRDASGAFAIGDDVGDTVGEEVPR